MTLADCWGLVRASEESGRVYMLSENCCYWEPLMMVRNMVRQRGFGDLTYAECGYVHDCRTLMFERNGTLTWRGEMARDYRGNLYPTHAIGPVAQWLGIHRGDRMVSLVAQGTGQSNLVDFIRRQFPKDHPAPKIRFQSADSVTTLIRTAAGALIDLRYDISSPRPVPTTTYYSLQGTRASYESRTGSIWINGRSAGHAWEQASRYAKEFGTPHVDAIPIAGGRDRPRGRRLPGGERLSGGGPIRRPCPDRCLRCGRLERDHPAVREVDRRGRRPQEIPDFTRGKWERRTPGRADA